MSKKSILIIGVVFFAAAFAGCSERKSGCFEKGNIGDCHALCDDGNSGACSQLQAKGLKECINGGDASICGTLCASKVPSYQLYCDKAQALCKLEKNKESDACVLFR